MLKVLGQDIEDLQARKEFLDSNADAVVEKDYHKPFDSEELSIKKTEFAEKHIRIAELEEKIKKYKDEINVELKPLLEDVKSLREDLKTKGRMVHEQVYQILDEEDKMVGFYNAEGLLIESRPATRDELQKTIYAELRKDGTHD